MGTTELSVARPGSGRRSSPEGSDSQRGTDVKSAIYWIDGPWPGRLAIVPRPRGGDWLDEEIGALLAEGVNILVSALTKDEAQDLELIREGEFSKNNGIEFLSLPIPDRGLPESFEKTEE